MASQHRKMERIEQLTAQLQEDATRYAYHVDELTELVEDLGRSLASLETWVPEKEKVAGAGTTSGLPTYAATKGSKPAQRFQSYAETSKRRPHEPIVLVEETATDSSLPDTVTVRGRKKRIVRIASATPELGESVDEEEENAVHTQAYA